MTKVSPALDPIGGQFAAVPNNNPVEVTRITWAQDDALPFPLCLTAQTDSAFERQYLENVTLARGNIVLADHGATIVEESIGTVPEPILFKVPTASGDRCDPNTPQPVIPRFEPVLSAAPVTQAEPYDAIPASARAVFQRQLDSTLPAVTLNSAINAQTATWYPVKDLLNSNSRDLNFVLETETDGRASIRFGDDRYGLRPNQGTRFDAIYRVGNGTLGNIGADTLTHIISDLGGISQIRNPLPAGGGEEPESIERVRQAAPFAFRVQERAVTLADYAAVAERHPEVQQAAATFRWTGSWRTVFITIDRRGGLPVDAPFELELRQHLERFRLAGYDLEIDAPRFVSLEIALLVCVKPNYFRSDVKAALLEVLSNYTLPDGSTGLFHPDRFTFGEAVYLSRIYETAQSVVGVASVQITVFQRQGSPQTSAIASGVLTIERLEIARIDNDPNFPERGVLRLRMEGGK